MSLDRVESVNEKGHAMAKLVAYYRVSTKGQGESGLGLDGQKAAVLAHANGTDGKIIAEFVEVESGKRADRPQLALALAHARAGRRDPVHCQAGQAGPERRVPVRG